LLNLFKYVKIQFMTAYWETLNRRRVRRGLVPVAFIVDQSEGEAQTYLMVKVLCPCCKLHHLHEIGPFEFQAKELEEIHAPCRWGRMDPGLKYIISTTADYVSVLEGEE